MKAHTGHKLQYVTDKCVVQQRCEIAESGDVVITGWSEVIDIDGDAYVYCDDCETRLSTEDGLSEDWMVI